MKKLRVVALGTIASMISLAAFMVACGDDDPVISADAGLDAQADTSQPDQNVAPEDAGTDAPSDGPPVPQFVSDIEQALCGSLARCCFGDANLPDGGDAGNGKTYNGNKCRELTKNLGFEFSSVGAELVDGGTVTISQAKSTECSQKLKALSCNLSGTELAATRAACFEAFVGSQTANAPCKRSIECQKGLYCQPDAGNCTALAGDGGSCNVFQGDTDENNSVTDEEACSWRGSGDTKLRCDSYDETTGLYRPRAEWTCKPQVGLDAGCNTTVWCADSVCDPFVGYYCKSPVPYFTGYCGRVVD